MAPWAIPCVALAGFTMLLSWILRRVRCVSGYRVYWVAMMLLSVMWLAMGVVTGRALYRFATHDFSRPAGDVGLFMIFMFVAWSLVVVPNLAILPSLLVAFPGTATSNATGRKRMLFVVWTIIALQASLLSIGVWAVFSGVWSSLLSL